ncbi:MAG: 4-(cytidine 5'-diphospho)-2-C-methyl-D-erythritol kinase [Acidobacteriia bacterium]|nr:4-(cytidine 5'-diphospho)-2-C-methyl-D-erythritol kinase [Terriglobia bacterium]
MRPGAGVPAGPARRARVRALAKINLDLRVLAKRPDGYHELRTIFQTISLADIIDIAFTPGRKTSIELEDELNIPDNLVVSAARLATEAIGARGRVEMRLAKRIPMGAGLGGGSSDAAAILLALPVLAGRPLEAGKMRELGEQLGSDVPFFLLGGRAVGIGRGSELFPLPDAPARAGVLVAPGIHVSTPDAYRHLSPRLTSESPQNKISSFQSQTWDLASEAPAANDFESVVFEQHGELALLKKRLIRAGASTAMLTGSGSALFGLFRNRDEVTRTIEEWKGSGMPDLYRISLVNRARYRAMWWRALGPYIDRRVWPPRSYNLQ